jgi:murein DD-endopeptidase MepM/ murein hydrolase activator NlpD
LGAAPELRLPIDGELGVDVWITSRPDVVPGSGFRDHAGGSHTYDGHSGTDFAVAGSREARSTWVLAPTGGTVLRTRDGVPDGQLLAGGTSAVGDDECGNGLVLDVGDGWEVQLCHLALGTLQVKPGDKVEMGARLGRVGWSGIADHPHVHLTVRNGTRTVDPFTGTTLEDATAAAKGSLWKSPVVEPSQQDALAWIGFRPGPEDSGLAWPIDSGQAVVPESAKSLVLEVFLWRPEKGDVVQTAIRAPDGSVTRGQVVQDRERPRQVWRVEKAWPEGPRPTGLWTAEVIWRRGDRARTLRTTTVLR